jgi:hypothetical protein
VVTAALLGMIQRGKGLLESEISSQASQEAREFRDMYKVSEIKSNQIALKKQESSAACTRYQIKSNQIKSL